MRSVQFDENLNAKHLRAACELEGLVKPLKFPRRCRGTTDDNVLAMLIPNGNLIVTNDRLFVESHLASMPEIHGGVLIVLQDDATPGHMTSHIAQTILARFKSDFPQWHVTDWSNSVIYLSPWSVEVLKVSSGRLETDGPISRRSPDWQVQFAEALNANTGMSSGRISATPDPSLN